MICCKSCHEQFDSEDEARDHIKDAHTAEIDEELLEYLKEAEDTVYDQFITED